MQSLVKKAQDLFFSYPLYVIGGAFVVLVIVGVLLLRSGSGGISNQSSHYTPFTHEEERSLYNADPYKIDLQRLEDVNGTSESQETP